MPQGLASHRAVRQAEDHLTHNSSWRGQPIQYFRPFAGAPKSQLARLAGLSF
jgi:hypothetical protein